MTLATRRLAFRPLCVRLLVAAALLSAGLVLAGDAPPWSDEQGRGEPTIVLIHGLGADRDVWSLVAPRLAGRHRLVRVELPGHGASPPIGTISLRTVARSVERALAARRVERALLVGHSYGAWVALEVAAANPKRAAGVVVLDMSAYTPGDTARVASLDRFLEEQYASLIGVIFQPMSEDRVEADSAVAAALRIPPEVMKGYLRDSWRVDLRDRIRRVKTPIHVIATAATWPPSIPWETARARFGYQTRGPVSGYRVANSAHLVMRDQPDTLAALVEGIAAGLAPAAAPARR